MKGDVHIRLDDSGPAGELLTRLVKQIVSRRERVTLAGIRSAVKASSAPGEVRREALRRVDAAERQVRRATR